MLDLLIKINKRKLDKMITKDYNYNRILRQSQKVDFLINLWYKYKVKYNAR